MSIMIGEGHPMEIPLHDILEERDAQDEKWGEQNHSPEVYYLILAEEVGELGKAILESHFLKVSPKCVREELVQVAAVALAMIECCDRTGWTKEATP